MLKSPLAVFVVAVVLTLVAFSADPQIETVFVANVEKALATKDAAGLQKLVWSEGVPAQFMKATEEVNKDALGKVVESKDWLAVDPDDERPFELGGTAYVLTPKPVKKLQLKFKRTGAAGESDLSELSMLVGERDGMLYFCMPAPTQGSRAKSGS